MSKHIHHLSNANKNFETVHIIIHNNRFISSQVKSEGLYARTLRTVSYAIATHKNGKEKQKYAYNNNTSVTWKAINFPFFGGGGGGGDGGGVLIVYAVSMQYMHTTANT